MVKVIRLVCIAGILALLVLFVLFTGASHSTKKGLNENSPKYQTNRTSHKDHKSIDSSTQNSSDLLEIIIPW